MNKIFLLTFIIYVIIHLIKKSGNPNKKNIVVKKYDFLQKSEEDTFVTESAFNDNLQKKMLVTPETIYRFRKINAAVEKELKLEYFFYTNKAEKAEALTKEIEKLNYTVSQSFYDEEKKVFVISGWTTKMKITDEIVKKWANQMCELGYRFDCEFDVLVAASGEKNMIQELDRICFESYVEKNKLLVKEECKQEHPEAINLENYRKYYLYGVVKSNPNISLRDIEIGSELYRKVIGNQSGMIIGNSLHPYFIFDKDVLDIWDFALIYEFKNNPEFTYINNNKITLIELSSTYDNGLIWDKEAKLTGDNNQFYAVYVPFIIPFLVYEETRNTEFDKNSGYNFRIDKYGNPYLDEINTILKKFMPQEVYALGFDELINSNYEQMIDKIINIQGFLQLHLLTEREMKNL